MRREIIEDLRKMEENGKINCYILSTDKGVCIKGELPKILASLACIVAELKDGGVPEDKIKYSFELGLKDNEEKINKMDKEINDLLEKIKSVMKDLGELKDE